MGSGRQSSLCGSNMRPLRMPWHPLGLHHGHPLRLSRKFATVGFRVGTYDNPAFARWRWQRGCWRLLLLLLRPSIVGNAVIFILLIWKKYNNIETKLASYALFRNKRFMRNLMPQRNASKFAIFYICKPKIAFSISCYFIFPLMNARVYGEIDQGIH